MTQSYPDGELPPPLPENDAPLMGNPILTRRPPRRSAHMGWYVGVPAAVIALGAVAIFVGMQAHQQAGLMTTPADTPAASAPVAAAAPPPAMTPAAPPAQVATAAPTETPVAPPREITPRPQRLAREDHPAHRAPIHQAPAATENGADVSATAPSAPPTVTAPSTVTAQPETPSTVTAPPEAPAAAAPPVITPPPS